MNTNTNTNRNKNQQAIGAFPNRSAAEQALHELRDSNFAMDQVSVVAKDSAQNETIGGVDVSDHADNKADDGAKVGALSGGAVGGLTGLLVGLGTLAIPGVGPIMLAGAAATALATTVAGGAIGVAAGTLLGGLIGMGIPEERAKIYHDRVSAGDYLVMVTGTKGEIAEAEAILNHRGIQEWGIYDVPATESATPSRNLGDRVNPVTDTSTVANPHLEKCAAPTDAETMKLYEERLIVDKDRQKIGEVAIGKHVEIETAQVSVPLQKERLVVVTTPSNGGTVAPSNADTFHDNESIRVEVYEETPTIRKESFVREEVSIHKEVNQETINAQETLRREELDIDTQGRPVIDNRSNQTETLRR